MIRRKKPHAEIILQKRVHPVERPPRAASGNREVFTADEDAEVLVAHHRRVETDVAGEHCVRLANEEMTLIRLGLPAERQFASGGFSQEVLQLFGRVDFAFDRFTGNHDIPARQVRQVDGTGWGGKVSEEE
jgi:hypothetical protein